MGGLFLWLLADSDDAPQEPVSGKVSDWIPAAKQYGEKYGVDPALILSFIEHESGGKLPATRFEKNKAGGQRYDKKGRPVVSRGLMQFLIGTAEQYGLPASQHEQLNKDGELGIDLGAQLLRDLQKRYNGKLYYIAAAYNGGPGGADKAYQKGGAVKNAHAHQYAQTAQALYQKWKAAKL
jgi:soluble lytic murein transglycosylase-like protein